MSKTRVTVACLLALFLTDGCDNDFLKFTWVLNKGKPDVEKGFIEAHLEGLSNSLAYRGTVAEQGWIEGLRLMRVRGYGIVAGLGTRGSRECPRRIRDRLVQEMYKRQEFSGSGLKPARLTPEQLIDDLDTAVVMIEGEIPAAALKGTRFEVTVSTVPGSQTTSLEGGRLYTANLHIYREVPTGGAVEGKVLATAAGPVFINPFGAKEDPATKRSTREGYVIGGGVTKGNRRLRFVLSRPSYQRARHITGVINARFPSSPKVAEAASRSYINLRIPPSFADDPFRFLALVRHLYLPQEQGFADKRAQDLAEEILDETAPHPDIALAWEGIGRTALPVVQELYTNPRPPARFYAALAGVRLGDDVAVEVLEQFATKADSPHRLTAIDALAHARRSTRAALVLRQLLDDRDPRIRVEAYEALLSRGDRVIESRPIGANNFALDTMPSSAENLIYVRRTGSQRVVLLGSGWRCLPPIFYQSPNRMLTVNADDDDENLTLIRRTPFSNRTSPPLPAALEVDELIAMLGGDPRVTSADEVHGLALDYSTITHALYELCRTRSINAKFMLQRTSVTEMFGPLTSTGRAESDL